MRHWPPHSVLVREDPKGGGGGRSDPVRSGCRSGADQAPARLARGALRPCSAPRSPRGGSAAWARAVGDRACRSMMPTSSG